VLSGGHLCIGPVTIQRSPTLCGVSEYDLEAPLRGGRDLEWIEVPQQKKKVQSV
jgi:hypothetical protein